MDTIANDRIPQILLIENVSGLGRVLGISLLEAGYAVSKVNQPEDVEARIVNSPVDVVVFNTGLAAQLKSDFIHGWRQVAPTIKILEISEEPLIKSAAGIDMEKVGAPDGYLAIPFLIEELPNAVESLLKGEE